MAFATSECSDNSSVLLTPAEREDFILKNRSFAYKLGLTFLRQWGSYLPHDDVQSLADIGLCETALRYRKDKGAQFQTLLYFYVKNEFVKEIRKRSNSNVILFPMRSENSGHSLEEMMTIERFIENEGDAPSPEDEYLSKEMKFECRKIFKHLSEMEKRVIIAVCVFEQKVASLARDLGYSRGHISEIKRIAIQKLRPHMEEFKKAA